MSKNKILEKILAIILIFTLTSANFAFVTKSYATFAGGIFSGKSDTGNKNVEFEAYFKTGDEKAASAISDVNNKDLVIGMELNIKDSGYLKNAKVEIISEEGEKLNFDVIEKEELEEEVRSFENNTIYLNQINKSSEVKLEVPIKYQNEEYVNEERISSGSLVVFTGTYVDNDGEEVEVSKEVELNLAWKSERQVEVETEMTKYIDYGAGVILQTVEKVNSSSEENTLPVKSSELEITAPLLKDVKPSKVTVVANTTKGTNGEEAGSVNFSEDNWNYNEEENKLTIKVENEKQKVEVNYNPDEYLQDAEKEIVEEERYYNGSGIDEFLVTYTYENVEIGEEALEVNTDVTAKMTTLSGLAEENIVTNSKEYNYELKEKSGDIVSLNIENKKEEISKAYTYVNYNNEGKYETEIPSEIMVNVSYKDIVEGIEIEDRANTYVDKEGNEIANNDIYYKTVGISKENFESILGENGEIKVKDEAGNVIFTINKETEVNEAGQILVGFAEKYTKLSFEMSKPEGEGNLVISVVKAIANASVDKGTYANIDRINSKTGIKANYSYVEGITELGEVETNEKLLDTATEANIVIDRESLSTVEENKDVEIRVELNNAKETSDVYGNSVYEIELPENVETVELTNVSLLYGEGLEIVDAVVEGRVIRVTIEGKQEGINSGVLTNGTNIVLNANIKVNIYTPAKSEVVKLRYNNSEATNYVDGGYKEVGIAYSAPTGLVAVTRISNYDNEGSIVESVRQGKKEGIIPVYGEARVATSEIVVMNNHNNTISNMSILGRIPYAGVKDIKTGEELGTTIDSKMASGIAAVEGNRGNFVVYYSENGEATRELDNEENGWTREPESLENIKSYLIVPEEENYVMEKSEILRFIYNYEIPENLKHNEYFYGTFGVYYRNNSEVASTNELAIAEQVGLTTGVGPELKVTVTPSKEQVKEYEEFALNITVENVGEVRAENVNVDVLSSNKATIVKYESDREDITMEDIIEREEYENSSGGVDVYETNLGSKLIIPNIEVGNTLELKVYLKANKLGIKVDFDENTNNTTTENLESDVIETIVKVTADDLGIELSQNYKIEVKGAEVSIIEKLTSNANKIERAGNTLEFTISITNENIDKKMSNLVITKVIPKEFELIETKHMDNYIDEYKINDDRYTYDANTRVLTWNKDSLEPGRDYIIQLTLKINELDESISKTRVETSSTVTADNIDTYYSNIIPIDIAKPILVITQTTNNQNTYIKEGELLEYNYLVKNEGEVSAFSVNLSNVVPDGIGIKNIRYTVNGVETNKTGLTKENINITTNIEPGAEMTVNLQAVALSLDGVEEKSVTNYAKLSSNEIKEIKSNSITHIVEASENNRYEEDGNPYIVPENNIGRTYKISGLAWFDSNQDGMRNNDEELLSGITAKLVDSTSGVIQKTVTTDSKGEYVFSGIGNGSYLVIFEYDSSKYTVTTYQKDGIVSNVNSDAVITTINQDGKNKEGAVTDVIKIDGGSVSNIDIGLVLLNKFDLKLDKAISKVMVQTSKETTTENYDNVSLAKADIASKYISGATVYVEYTIKVSNVGDISGYAKKIVDYLPKGMNFNSSLELNSDWYTGTDGNLYSEKLANKELKSGESAELKLVLTKQMTEENTGIVNNLAEIYEDYNTYGIADKNSTPGNKVQNENDMGSADLIISIKTGEMFIYISIIITTILLGSIVVFITYNKLVISKRKWVM